MTHDTRIVGVSVSGKIEYHMPDTTGNCYTLCGLDGGQVGGTGADWDGNQSPVYVPVNAKINCRACLSIFQVVSQYSESDFEGE